MLSWTDFKKPDTPPPKIKSVGKQTLKNILLLLGSAVGIHVGPTVGGKGRGFEMLGLQGWEVRGDKGQGASLCWWVPHGPAIHL